jgi:hypothetical protein
LFFAILEYELVAGGEELFQENGLLAHKPGATHVSPSSDVRVKEECRDVQSPLAPRTPSDSSDFQSENDESAGGLDALHALDAPDERTPAAFLASVPLAHNPQQPRSAIKDEGYDLHLPGTVPPISSLMTTSVAPPHIVRNSVAGVTLSAAGMRPLHIEVDQYAPPSPTPTNFSPRVSIHIKLSLSSLHDVSSPPALHGFSGTVTFAAPWTSVAQCVTRVFAGGVCESVEYAYFEPAASLSPLSMAPVTVPLPESELSRCRWGNIGGYCPDGLQGSYTGGLVADTWPCTGVETRIDQVVTVDHEEVAWIAYDLTWTASGPPSAEILNVQRDPQEHPQQQQQQLVSAPTPVPEPASFLSVNSWNSEPSYAPYASYVPRSQEPPIAYSPYSCLAGSPNGDQQYTQYSSVLFS